MFKNDPKGLNRTQLILLLTILQEHPTVDSLKDSKEIAELRNRNLIRTEDFPTNFAETGVLSTEKVWYLTDRAFAYVDGLYELPLPIEVTEWRIVKQSNHEGE